MIRPVRDLFISFVSFVPIWLPGHRNECDGTCSSMRVCPYTEGRMAAATSGFDLGSLVPELPGAGVINQLINPWN